MKILLHDGISFHFRDEGRGLPFVFQHGLGGDLNQPIGLYSPEVGVRLIAFDMRGHGETRPVGDADKLTIANFADDSITLFDHLGIEQAAIGGISLGAAVAVNVALRYPDRVLGLVLVRPAWIDRPLPENVSRYATIAGLIRTLGPRDGLVQFHLSPEFLNMERESPDCARSLVAQFEHPRAVECVARLEQLAADTPCSDVSAYGRLEMPTLILGNRQDPIHPWPLAGKLAEIIPGAKLREITPKSVSIDRHAADVTRSINAFLAHHLGESR